MNWKCSTKKKQIKLNELIEKTEDAEHIDDRNMKKKVFIRIRNDVTEMDIIRMNIQ